MPCPSSLSVPLGFCPPPGCTISKYWQIGSQQPYHYDRLFTRFLELSSLTYAQELVPSLDIDLVWHTHQLMSTQYHKDCLQYVGYFLDQ
jgi:hypothetical protein